MWLVHRLKICELSAEGALWVAWHQSPGGETACHWRAIDEALGREGCLGAAVRLRRVEAEGHLRMGAWLLCGSYALGVLLKLLLLRALDEGVLSFLSLFKHVC